MRKRGRSAIIELTSALAQRNLLKHTSCSNKETYEKPLDVINTNQVFTLFAISFSAFFLFVFLNSSLLITNHVVFPFEKLHRVTPKEKGHKRKNITLRYQTLIRSSAEAATTVPVNVALVLYTTNMLSVTKPILNDGKSNYSIFHL